MEEFHALQPVLILLFVGILAIAASMALTPVLVGYARKMSNRKASQDWKKSQKSEGGQQGGSAPVIIVGMGDVGRCVANSLDAQDIVYRGIELNHDCFVNACSNGYSVGFGDATDLRLMETIKMSQAKMIVITFADYEICKELAPIVMEHHTDLKLLVSVKTDEDKIRFDELGMIAVVQHSFPRGLDMAAAVLKEYKVDHSKIQKWMQKQQAKELDISTIFDKKLVEIEAKA